MKRGEVRAIFGLLVALVFAGKSNAQVYHGTANIPGPGMVLDLWVFGPQDSVYAELSGPSSGYFAVGFDAAAMNGTYAWVVQSTGVVNEYKLGNHQPGVLLGATTQSNSSASAGVRTATISRGRVGLNADYFTFPASASSIGLIWAKGGTTFSNHGGANRGLATLTLQNLCSIPPTTLPLISACAGDSVQVFGQWTKVDGLYRDTLVTALGCDSVLEQEVMFYSTGPDQVFLAPVLDAYFLAGMDTAATYYWFNCADSALTVLDTTVGIDTNAYVMDPPYFYMPASEGFFAAWFVGPGGCVDTTECVEVFLGLQEFENRAVLYPNPGREELRLYAAFELEGLPYSIWNEAGQIIVEGRLKEQPVWDVRNWPVGTYFLQIENRTPLRWSRIH